MRGWSVLLGLSCALAWSGCSHSYTILPADLARAARDLQHHEETQVQARASDGREVVVRLGRSASLFTLDADGNYLDEGWIGPDDAIGPLPGAVARVEYSHHNFGVPLLAGGLAGFVAGVLLQSLFATDVPEYGIPLAGPVLAMRHNFNSEDQYRYCDDEGWCEPVPGEDHHREKGMGNLLTLLTQLAGLGVALGGVLIWDGSPEVGPADGLDPEGGLSFRVEPMVYTGGGGGGSFVLRF